MTRRWLIARFESIVLIASRGRLEIDAHNLTAGGWPFRGHLLDLRTPAFVLTDRGHTLESACEMFGLPFVKRDV
jgi:hypothetical protein